MLEVIGEPLSCAPTYLRDAKRRRGSFIPTRRPSIIPLPGANNKSRGKVGGETITVSNIKPTESSSQGNPDGIELQEEVNSYSSEQQYAPTTVRTITTRRTSTGNSSAVSSSLKSAPANQSQQIHCTTFKDNGSESVPSSFTPNIENEKLQIAKAKKPRYQIAYIQNLCTIKFLNRNGLFCEGCLSLLSVGTCRKIAIHKY